MSAQADMPARSTVEVHIPPALRDFADGAVSIPVRARSVREALASLAEDHELLINHILTRGGVLRPYVNIFVGEEDIRALSGLDTPLPDRGELVILPSVAGG